ncbi:excalibur calcium-binding domain-containing protein [Rhodococcus spongiicola]|uniref:excalibur calcium-binding domain-containing protein n=1 Tax=Rhodococcus spongiicola TaxID=2487352 RepID=UPI001F46F102
MRSSRLVEYSAGQRNREPVGNTCQGISLGKAPSIIASNVDKRAGYQGISPTSAQSQAILDLAAGGCRAHPHRNPRTSLRPHRNPRPHRSRRPHRATVSFKNCDAVRAGGAAPLYEGQPGYSTKLNRDRTVSPASEWVRTAVVSRLTTCPRYALRRYKR